MRPLSQALAALSLLLSSTAVAQQSPPSQSLDLCRDQLAEDHQPGFNADPPVDLSNETIKIIDEGTDNPRLQLDTRPRVLDPESITFPFDQNVTISYVYESAGASHALGYMYMRDVVTRGYADANGNLLDSNSNGILDLHEDIYNLAPPTGNPGTRPYIGVTRRCNQTFTSGGVLYSQPEIAMRAGCGSTFAGNRSLNDARPGRFMDFITTDVVGTQLRTEWWQTNTAASNDFSDGGLFKRIPNLLEPPSVSNNNMGLGKMVFLLADDDGEEESWGNLGPVADDNWADDGVPDYDTSEYDPRGLRRSFNPDEGITSYDRTVDLGLVEGNQEIVFFLVVFYDTNHQPDLGNVFPCLKQDSEGKCLLHLKSPIKVYFTKAAWNMDQNAMSGVVAERNIGCSYDAACAPDNAQNETEACTVANSGGRNLCGWLDGPKTAEGTTLWRLKNLPAYGNLDMPMEAVTVPRPEGVRNPMPHVIMGAPSTDPFRWILGFEDLPGGGDRDFNDVVFVINKQNGGGARSGAMSRDISPNPERINDDFVITKVRFKRQDDSTPAPRTCPGGPPCWTETTPGACTPSNGIRPSIRYSVAVNCRICTNGNCVPNLYPNWVPVEFPSPTAQEVELDMMELGFTGSQLCWKVDITSPNERCQPIIDNVDVGYQAVKAGSYARASPSTVGNALLWGVNETPGSNWGQNWPGTVGALPAAEERAYDGRKDFSLRGRLYFRSLYDPEASSTTNVVQRWEAGRVMALALSGGGNPSDRKLFTLASNGTRATVASEAGDDDDDSLLFPDGLCDEYAYNRWLYDLNGDGRCGTPSSDSPDKLVASPNDDRTFFVEWLHGWEDRRAPGRSNVKRPWPMGGINLSTVAVAVPPYLDSWSKNARPDERDLYRANFLETLKNRKTMAYVGTMNGFLHAFNSGLFSNEARDNCVNQSQLRGYFKPTGSCSTTPPTPRAYGTGVEEFAYLPRGLLERYINLYVQFPGSGSLPRPQVDASPAIANVDFGGLDARWKPSTASSRTTGAKTVLVSATGKKSPVVFALDITNPDDAWYPLPLWEFDMKKGRFPVPGTFFSVTVDDAFTVANETDDDDDPIVFPDRSGSRHAPSVSRLAWGPGSTGIWTAVVGTDYVPEATNRAGTIYLIDMKTGRPLNFGTSLSGYMAGIITLDQGSGVAAEAALVDLKGSDGTPSPDGTYDVMYVPTTAGNVYRINLDQVDVNAPLGRKVKTCKVASAPVTLASHADAAQPSDDQPQDPIYQQIHSNLAVKVDRASNGEPTVRFYFGTSDNPDESTDGPPNKNTYRYHLLGYEDTDPDGSEPCDDVLDPLFVQKLDPGQTVWGGVTLVASKVFATTAVGRSADICNLSSEESGRLYESGQLPEGGVAPAMSSSSLDGHGINAPVVHDQHLFILTATGDMKIMGGNNWNNGTAGTGSRRSRMLIYDPNSDGRLPQ